MNHAHIRGRRLAVAVTAVLAVTAVGGTLVTAPAAEATMAAPAAANATVTLPAGEKLVSSGNTGFLTSKDDGAGGTALTWTRFDDGSRTPIPGALAYTSRSDTIITREGNRFVLRDMSVSMFVSYMEPTGIGTEYKVVGAAGSTLFLTVPNRYGGEDLYRLTRVNGVQQQESISAVPTARDFKVTAHSLSTALVFFTKHNSGGTSYYRALTDLGGNFMRPERSALSFDPATLTGAISPSYVAWTTTVDGFTRVAVEKRSEYEPFKYISLGAGTSGVVVGFSGDWLLYGVPGGLTASTPNPLYALTAQNVLTGETTTLLDHFTATSTAPDGSLFVQGGKATDGEGLFKITEGASPQASLVAGTPGASTAPAVVRSTVPPVAQLDRNGGQVAMEWELSRYNVHLDVTLRHNVTGKTFTKRLTRPSAPARLTWDGLINGASAPNGDYTWHVVATPANGIGNPGYANGTLKVTRQANPHDYTDNGSPDLLARDAAGVLWRDDLLDSPVGGQVTPAKPRVKIGPGWNTYNVIEAAGNIAGSGAGDVLARDTAGVLWTYISKGDGTFGTRTKVGPGWGVYNKLAAGSDLTGDGRDDLVATDASGALWLYKGTGSATVPYAGRVRVGPGWGGYNQLTAVGNIAGGVAGDLVARDASGVLWLYLGKGDGTFAARTKIGTGWGGYSQLVGVGDANNDGRPDLVAYGSAGTHVFLGTGSWSAPFTKTVTSLYAGEGTKFTSVS
ncbi:FG-GAP repeat domain-containing protein [Streptomyces venezuelae]|uniref:FG-GAP repeat domain-containing protein n=1 Tax=Streptomyces gardneri TaxID=66892 RepID=UPI0006BD208B|nr:VCBS repeat-containing protein [Streptomyces gardneri]ALO10273.1 FG-GAP repeat domain-containing protein [Streptomyces venezuelae]QPK47292.1 VCBS repeat-containing protein [Streptomyces gardneri]WRK38716.1 VCBS repeat-containing protein [Streptomyces venezuelae]CUM39268.1 N-acetylmuramoyl-L-alanine amidase [Streptomyces venezuelae]